MVQLQDSNHTVDENELCDIFDSELLEIPEVADFWKGLAEINYGDVNAHVASAVLCTYRDGRFKEALTPFE